MGQDSDPGPGTEGGTGPEEDRENGRPFPVSGGATVDFWCAW